MLFLMYFFGKDDPIVEVMAWGARLVHDRKATAEDNALLVLKFSSGGIGHCELSWTTKGGLDLRNQIHGSEGSVFTDVTRGTPISAYTTRSAGYVVEKAEMRHFVDCVRDGLTPRETYEDGYVVNCVLEAGYRAMRSGRWIRTRT